MRLLFGPGFGGEVPLADRQTLPESAAQTARNVDLTHGTLRPIAGQRAVSTLPKTGTVTAIHRFQKGNPTDTELAIEGVSLVNPLRLTITGHGLTTGAAVYIAGVGGTTELNGAWYDITKVDDDTISLDGIDGTSGYSAYTSGGYAHVENGVWFHWNDTEAPAGVNVARGPIDGDTAERTYWTGEGTPKMTFSPVAVTGGTREYPLGEYTLGVPAPTTAPSTAVTGTGTGNPQSYLWAYTYLTDQGEEGPPVFMTSPVEVEDGESVDLSNMDTGPAGAYDVSYKRIYRAQVAASGAAAFFFRAQIAVANTTYTDDMSTTGEELLTTTWDPPPTDMAGLVAGPNGMMAGFSANQVCICEPYQPHAWPTEYRVTFPTDVVAIGVDGQSFVVVTESRPYRLDGIHPDSLTQTGLDVNQAGVSRRSMVTMGEGAGVLWASADGLCDGYGRNVIEQWMGRDEWRALNPPSIHAYSWDGCYLAFYTKADGTQGGFIFDPGGGQGALTFTDVYADAGYLDPLDGNLYLAINDTVVRWDGADTNLTLTWKSAQRYLGRPSVMRAAQVIARSYASTTLKVYADEVLVDTIAITSGKPVRIDKHDLATTYEVEVTGTDDVVRVALANSMAELAAA